MEIHALSILRDLVPLVQLKKLENTHGGVFLLVNLEAYFNKSNAPS